MSCRLRAKERQQQKQQITIQNQPISEKNHIETVPLINIKDEKIEPSTNLSSPILKVRKDFSIAKSIAKRREEINERSNNKSILPSNRSARLIQGKQSSSTTNITFQIDRDFHSQISTDILPKIDDREDVVESKSFIHNLDFHLNE